MTDYTLFKFRKIDKYFIESIVNRQIYFALLSQLNDPFDCNINILQALDNAIKKSKPPVNEKLLLIKSDIKIFCENFQNDLPAYGICSFSLDAHEKNGQDSNLMWAHYSDNHRGVCLQYKFPCSFFNSNPYKVMGVSEVTYGENVLTDWFLNEAHLLNGYDEAASKLMKKVFTAKSASWKYEGEARILRKTPGLQPIEKQYLKEIYFGLATPESDIQLVRKIAEKNEYDVTFWKSSRDDDKDFGIKLEKI